MALSVKKAALWRRELENRPGSLAQSLEHFAKKGVNLQILSGYSYQSRAGGAVEVFPITEAKAEEAAKSAGFSKAENNPCLIIEGDDRPGVVYEMTQAIANDGINLQFLQSQGFGNKYVAILGFFSDHDCDRASALLEKVKVA
jgi:hypothetical protein